MYFFVARSSQTNLSHESQKIYVLLSFSLGHLWQRPLDVVVCDTFFLLSLLPVCSRIPWLFYRRLQAYHRPPSTLFNPGHAQLFSQLHDEYSAYITSSACWILVPVRIFVKPNHRAIVKTYIQQCEEHWQWPTSSPTFSWILATQLVESVHCSFRLIAIQNYVGFVIHLRFDFFVMVHNEQHYDWSVFSLEHRKRLWFAHWNQRWLYATAAFDRKKVLYFIICTLKESPTLYHAI